MNDQGQGTPTKPVHIVNRNLEKHIQEIEDLIKGEKPFTGKWQTYIEDDRLFIPEELQPLLTNGGVVCLSTEDHLLLFGGIHWTRFERILSREVGLSPVHNAVARHIYSNMYRFNSLDDAGFLNIPSKLLEYANIKGQAAIIGLMYHAEIHSLDDYKQNYDVNEKPETKSKLLSSFRKIFN